MPQKDTFLVQEFKPDLLVGISYYVCTAMLSAKLGIPYVSVTPGEHVTWRHTLVDTLDRADIPLHVLPGI